MQVYFVYILKSLVHNRFYVGHTSNLEERLRRHNAGLVHSTKAYKPWKIVYTENKDNKSDAYKREMQIKSYKHGEALKKLIKE